MDPTALALACGLATAACFGTGDFLAQRLTQREGWLPAVFGVQIGAAILLGGAALLWHGLPPAERGPEAWLALAGLGLVNTLGLIALYRAFESGKLSLVSPIAGSMGAFTVVFAWLAGQPPAARLLPGLGAVVLGIVLASMSAEDTPGGSRLRVALGVGWALLSAVAFGWMFLRLGAASVDFGPAWAVTGLRLVAVAVLGAATLRLRRAGPRPTPGDPTPPRGLVLVVALFDSAGMLLFAWAGAALESGSASGGALAVLAVLASCFPLVTIAWVRLSSRESLHTWQWLGVGLVVLGVAWISLLRP